MRFNAPFVSFNGGEIGKEVQGRTTIDGYGATASRLENILAEGAGPMTFRRGLKFCVASPTPSAYTHMHPFVYRLNQKYLLMFTDEELRIVENGGIVVRPNVDCNQIANGTFTGLAGWVNYSAGDSTAESGDQELILYCDGPNPAGIYQAVMTNEVGNPHHLDIQVRRGPVDIKIGISINGEEILETVTLRTGHHRLAFTPTASTFYIDLSSSVRRDVILKSITLALTGADLVLPTPWAAADLRSLRMRQDLNVMFIADGTQQRRRLERRGSSSWSLVLSDEKDGPFLTTNIDETIIVAPTTRQGNGQLLSSKPLWKPSDVGSLFKLTQNGQYAQRVLAGEDQWTQPVRVTGVGSARSLTWTTSGTWSATVRLQRSVGNDSTWEDVTNTSIDDGVFTTTSNTGSPFSYADGEDNSIIYYRVGIKTGQYTSGSANVTIFFPGGATDGIARITGYVANDTVDMEVLSPFAALSASSEWAKGAWSDILGWPKGTTIFDGRMWSGFGSKFWGSVSESFESQKAGDQPADAIARSISVGDQAPNVTWALSLSRLIIGCEGSEVVVRSNSLDEPLTTTSMTVREMSTYGSADVNPIKIDTRGVFVERSTRTPMELVYDPQVQDYIARPMTRMHRDIGRSGGIKQLAVARQPETRVFMVRGDGQCLVKLYDPGENVLGWSRILTPGASGAIESVAVLPNQGGEDEVYFMVRRTIEGATVRYLEQMDPMYIESAAAANCLDSYVRYEGAPANNIPVGFAAHLIGQGVKVWADGAYMGTNVINVSGQLTTPLASTKEAITVGLGYTGRYRSSKLAFGAKAGTAIGQQGRPASIVLLLLDAVTAGIRIGGAFNNRMVGISTYLGADSADADEGEAIVYDSGPGLIDATTRSIPLPNATSNDPRLCIEFHAPFPATLQGYTIGHHLDEKVRA